MSCHTDSLVSSGSSIQKRKYNNGYHIKHIQKNINKLQKSISARTFRIDNTSNTILEKENLQEVLIQENNSIHKRISIKAPKTTTTEYVSHTYATFNDTVDTVDYFNPNFSNPIIHPKALSSKKNGIILSSTLLPAVLLSLLIPIMIPITTITYLVLGINALKQAKKAKHEIQKKPTKWLGLEEIGIAKALNWVVIGLCSFLLFLQLIFIIFIFSLFLSNVI